MTKCLSDHGGAVPEIECLPDDEGDVPEVECLPDSRGAVPEVESYLIVEGGCSRSRMFT